MSAASDGLAASAVKASFVYAGTAVSWFGDLSPLQLITAVLTCVYTALLVFKSIPWVTDYMRAINRGLHGDWSYWWKLAKRGEARPDEGGGDAI